MMEGTGKSKAVWLAAGGILLVAAAYLCVPLTKACKKDYRIAIDQNDPELSLLTAFPGGLRMPVIVWNQIQADEKKIAGKQYDAVQRAETICRLMPYFPTIWTFYGHDMIWNRSVQTRTPDERWLWISNGIKLLRNEAIPKNPKAFLLHMELSLAFYMKIGGTSDDMHFFYKQRFAKEMQDLLGAPPQGTTEDAIKAFEPVAMARVDRNIPGSERQIIQEGPLQELLSDQGVARYIQLFSEFCIRPDRSFLDTYNQYSLDAPVSITRMEAPFLETEKDKKISSLMNSTEHAAARNKILAFVRAQILWNVYKMDPSVMLDLMKKYNAPFDWRNAHSHGFYWADAGNKLIGEDEISNLSSGMQMNLLNNERNQLNSIKELTWTGRMTYKDNPRSVNYPSIWFSVDVRYVQPAHELHVHYNTLQARATRVELNRAQLAEGHRNYLVTAIQMLVALNKIADAQKYLDYIRDNYKMAGGYWDEKDVRDFVISILINNWEMHDSFVTSQLESSLMTALVALAAGDQQAFGAMYSYAQKVRQAWNQKAADRMKFPPLDMIGGAILTLLAVEPYAYGYEISLINRSMMYRTAPHDMQLRAYLELGHKQSPLPGMCKAAGLDFKKAFPEPPGFAEYQARVLQQLRQEKPDDKDTKQYEFKKGN